MSQGIIFLSIFAILFLSLAINGIWTGYIFNFSRHTKRKYIFGRKESPIGFWVIFSLDIGIFLAIVGVLIIKRP